MQYVEQRWTMAANYITASAGKLKKLDSIHREDIRIYNGAFRISPVEALHVNQMTHVRGNGRSLKLEVRDGDVTGSYLSNVTKLSSV